ncbi:MAG: hypothetical protein L6Q35_01135 [Phycisphaerales bacterium]|nr:hypothetical protein [Phycisphaerales bacterium]
MLAPGASSAYSIARPTGVCALTGQAISVGERFVATLVEIDGEQDLRRVDFSAQAWEQGARPTAGRLFATWTAVMAEPTAKKRPLLTDDELLDMFDQFAPSTDRRRLVFRYLLALALLRRRLLRHEGSRGTIMLVRRRGAGADDVLEVLDPGMDDAAVSEAMEELSRIIPLDEPAAGAAT